MLNLLHYTHAVSSQICPHLGIYCFSVKKRPLQQTSGETTSNQTRTKAAPAGSGRGGVTTRQQAGGKKTK